MIIIENGTVWSGKADGHPSRKNIVIEGGIIKHVLSGNDSADLPTDIEKIDASSKFVMPGLINCHTHICFDGSADPVRSMLSDGPLRVAIKAAESAKRFLKSGITTIRDLGGFEGVDIALRDAIEDGLTVGPRILASGKVICMTGGHLHYMGCEVDGPEEARKGVRKQLKSNVDLIKVMATGGVLTRTAEPGASQLTQAELATAVEEAGRAGKRVACHAHAREGILNAVHAGVNSIEHGTFLDEKIAETMARKGIYLVPTVISIKRVTELGSEVGTPEFMVRRAGEIFQSRLKSLTMAFEAGVRIVAGTDSGTPMNPHGEIIDELLLLYSSMSAKEVLAAATSLAAAALGIEDRLGTLEEGKIADLLILDGNPLMDLTALRKIALVMKKGEKCVFRQPVIRPSR
jgi:imidazolonepropionase-like amidohydrolase